jgi:hypothetical protein
MNSKDEFIEEYERIFQKLIQMPPARFDQQLKAAPPKANGLYAISMIECKRPWRQSTRSKRIHQAELPSAVGGSRR